MPKRPLPLAASVVLNHLRMDAEFERRLAIHEVDDDAPCVPSFDPLSNPQSRRRAVDVN